MKSIKVTVSLESIIVIEQLNGKDLSKNYATKESPVLYS